MDILSQLNREQRLAVEHGPGPALVLAGAGSGKTRVITCRIAYLIRNAASRPENILAVTFTNKAAEEMKERVKQLVGPSRSAEPLISTFHSFCVRLLRREIDKIGYKRDFSIYDTDDQKRMIKNILSDMAASTEWNPKEIQNRISYAKNHGTPPEHYAGRFPFQAAELIQKVYAQYNQRLMHANALDFDDLLLKAAEVLQRSPDTRKFYSKLYFYILVDEYQDTNHPQYELLQLLTAEHKNLFVVGDEDQSIYKFRGADIQNILQFEKDFPGTKIIKLEQNYRSSQNILQTAGAVVGNNTERKGKTLWTRNGQGDLITSYGAASPREEAVWIADQIRDTLRGAPESRLAVLYRTNFLSRNFEDVLTDAGIPYAVVGSVAFFGRKEIKDMLAFLRVLFNPEDDIALLRIINTPARGIGNSTVEMLTEFALEKGISLLQAAREKSNDSGLPSRTTGALRRFLDLVDKWNTLKEKGPVENLLASILEDIQYARMVERNETTAEAENRLFNIEELIRAAHESESRGETVSEFLDRAALSSELDHLDPDARVSLMTLHSAKGLEFDTVFLAGMEEGLFPHSHSLNSSEDLEEERRLCYVGITRARQKLYLTWTPFRKSYGPTAGGPSSVSRFLAEMPDALMERIESSAINEFDQTREYASGFYRPGSRPRNPRIQPHIKVSPAGPRIQPKTIAELRAYVESQQKSPGNDGDGTGKGPILKPGTRVVHDSFGEGIVLSRERSGNDVKLVVTFSRAGRKSLMEKYAKLKVLR
jgi:DNA helicase-2/ATP-dependent DNA helicase PcrA